MDSFITFEAVWTNVKSSHFEGLIKSFHNLSFFILLIVWTVFPICISSSSSSPLSSILSTKVGTSIFSFVILMVWAGPSLSIIPLFPSPFSSDVSLSFLSLSMRLKANDSISNSSFSFSFSISFSIFISFSILVSVW